jgi:Tfp pilus assembly protein PilF
MTCHLLLTHAMECKSPLTPSSHDVIRLNRLSWFCIAMQWLALWRRLVRVSTTLTMAAFLLSVSQIANAQTDPSSCGPLTNAYGPFDYRKEREGKLHVVEAYHFTPNIENLIRGNSGSLGSELNYTLRASPNHHRALMSMMRLVDRLKTEQPPGSDHTMDCWFDRALRFQPDDTIVRMIFATYLAEHDRKAEAMAQLERATAAAADNAFTHYNIGLVYFDLKEYDKSLQQAHKAMAMGFQRTALREMLQKAGHWEDPPAEPATKVEAKQTP